MIKEFHPMEKSPAKKFKTVDEYFSNVSIKGFGPLETLRNTIKEVVPEAEEVISYNMPAFKLNGILVYYAAHREHIGFYPANASLIGIFKNELSGYETSKGTIKFPLDKPLPIGLIKKIVRYRVKENLEKQKNVTRDA